MIRFHDVSDSVAVNDRQVVMLSNVSLALPSGHLAILADNPFARRPLVDLLSGLRPPYKGHVAREGCISWPIGRYNFLHRHLTGLSVLQAIARVYDLDIKASLAFLEGILTEPWQIERPIGTWSTFSRFEFGNALALLPAFDIYIVDGSIEFSKERFGFIWQELFLDRIRDKTLLMSCLSVPTLKKYCRSALVVADRQLRLEEDLESAILKYPAMKVPVYATDEKDDELGGEDEI